MRSSGRNSCDSDRSDSGESGCEVLIGVGILLASIYASYGNFDAVDNYEDYEP